jgi:hypothetical protein
MNIVIRLPFFHREIGYHGSNIGYQIMELVTIIFIYL